MQQNKLQVLPHTESFVPFQLLSESGFDQVLPKSA